MAEDMLAGKRPSGEKTQWGKDRQKKRASGEKSAVKRPAGKGPAGKNRSPSKYFCIPPSPSCITYVKSFTANLEIPKRTN